MVSLFFKKIFLFHIFFSFSNSQSIIILYLLIYYIYIFLQILGLTLEKAHDDEAKAPERGNDIECRCHGVPQSHRELEVPVQL
jgi:hypothetical protein